LTELKFLPAGNKLRRGFYSRPKVYKELIN
jgi:hypothetical protein